MRKSPRPQPEHRSPGPSSLPSGDNSPQPLASQPADAPPRGRRSRLTTGILLTTSLMGVAALGYLGHQLRQPAPIYPTIQTPAPSNQPQLAAGTPLEHDTADIQVLTPPSAATITVLSPSTPAPAISYPQPYNDTPLRLGLTLTLLQQTIAAGQPAAQSLASTATQLAQTLQDDDLAQALTLLTKGLPATGPITLSAILTEISRLEILGAPPAPEPASGPTTPSPSTVSTTAPVWRKLVNQLVTIKPVVSSTNPQAEAWHTAITSAHQALALNRPAEALFILSQPPLNPDARLHTLISLVHDYATTQQQLNAVLQAYSSHYLLPTNTPTTEATP